MNMMIFGSEKSEVSFVTEKIDSQHPGLRSTLDWKSLKTAVGRYFVSGTRWALLPVVFVGVQLHVYKGYNPSYPVIRPFIGVVTPFITTIGAHLIVSNIIYIYFTAILREIIQFDQHFSNGLKPTNYHP